MTDNERNIDQRLPDQQSQDLFTRSIMIKIINLRIQCILYALQTIVFSVLLYRVATNFWHVLQKSLKIILILFEVLLLMATVNNAFMSWGVLDEPLSVQYRAYVETFIYDNINGSLFLLLFYKVLYTFKAVEVQVNPKYESAEAVLDTLKKYKVTECIILSLNGIIALSSIILWIKFSFRVQGESQKVYNIIYTVIVYVNFSLNLYMVCYFHRMAMFYVRTLGKKF